VATSGSARIADTHAEYYASRDRVFLVIWLDFCPSGGGSEAVSGPNTTIKRQYATTDGNSVQWKCHTVDGKTGTIIINGVEYDLAKGGLFLVAAKQDKLQVTQLNRDFERPKSEHETFEAFDRTCQSLAKSDPEIKDFIGADDKSD